MISIRTSPAAYFSIRVLLNAERLALFSESRPRRTLFKLLSVPVKPGISVKPGDLFGVYHREFRYYDELLAPFHK